MRRPPLLVVRRRRSRRAASAQLVAERPRRRRRRREERRAPGGAVHERGRALGPRRVAAAQPGGGEGRERSLGTTTRPPREPPPRAAAERRSPELPRPNTRSNAYVGVGGASRRRGGGGARLEPRGVSRGDAPHFDELKPPGRRFEVGEIRRGVPRALRNTWRGWWIWRTRWTAPWTVDAGDAAGAGAALFARARGVRPLGGRARAGSLEGIITRHDLIRARREGRRGRGGRRAMFLVPPVKEGARSTKVLLGPPAREGHRRGPRPAFGQTAPSLLARSARRLESTRSVLPDRFGFFAYSSEGALSWRLSSFARNARGSPAAFFPAEAAPVARPGFASLHPPHALPRDEDVRDGAPPRLRRERRGGPAPPSVVFHSTAVNGTPSARSSPGRRRARAVRRGEDRRRRRSRRRRSTPRRGSPRGRTRGRRGRRLRDRASSPRVRHAGRVAGRPGPTASYARARARGTPENSRGGARAAGDGSGRRIRSVPDRRRIASARGSARGRRGGRALRRFHRDASCACGRRARAETRAARAVRRRAPHVPWERQPLITSSTAGGHSGGFQVETGRDKSRPAKGDAIEIPKTRWSTRNPSSARSALSSIAIGSARATRDAAARPVRPPIPMAFLPPPSSCSACMPA